MSMKNSNDIIGNRTRDLPTCNAVPCMCVCLCVCVYIYIYIYIHNAVHLIGAVHCHRITSISVSYIFPGSVITAFPLLGFLQNISILFTC